MIGVVLDILLARFQEFPSGQRIGSGNEASFAGGVAADIEEKEGTAAGFANVGFKSFVLLFVN